MFDNLLESKVRRQRSFSQAVVSLAVHGAVIFAAVKATQGVAETIRETPIDTSMIFLSKPAEPTPPTRAASPPPSDAVVSVNPPPKGFKTVSAPIEIPKEIPPIDFNQKPFDPKDFTGQGIEGGSALGVVGGTGPLEGGGGGIGGGGSGVYNVGDLDDPVQAINIPEPRYPPALQSAMISGRVELQYVVDTTGRAEPNSFKILTQSHQAFVNPAKEAILKGVFKPAKFRGRPVRQLVQQAISFKAGQ
jgi:protein TonB